MVKITLEFSTAAEAQEALKLLSGGNGSGQLTLPEAPAEPKRKAGRPPKTGDVVVPAAPAAAVVAPAPAAPAGEVPSIKDVQDALVAYVKKNGKDKGFAILQAHKAKMISEIPEGERAAVIAEAKV